MRVCLIHRYYPPEEQGGICTYVHNIAHALVEQGHTVHVIARSTASGDYDHMDGPVYVHRLRALAHRPALHYAYLGASHAVRLLTGIFVSRVVASRRVALKLEQLIAEQAIDIVEAPEWEAENFWYTLFSERRIPALVKLHTPTFMIREMNQLPRDRGFEFLSWMERQETLLADKITSPSGELARLVGTKWGVPLRDIAIVPYPIDVQAFRPGDQARKPGDPVILYVGRIERRKGVHTLLCAMPIILKRVPRARLRLVGADTLEGPRQTSFSKFLAQSLDDETRSAVEFLGPRPRDELLQEYQACSVCALPSLFENFPNVCLEAMACGAPVVGSQSGGMAEMIEPGVSGLIVSPGDPGGLADAIVQMLEDSISALRMGQAARQRIEDAYSPQQVARRTIDLYEKVIAEKGRAQDGSTTAVCCCTDAQSRPNHRRVSDPHDGPGLSSSRDRGARSKY